MKHLLLDTCTFLDWATDPRKLRDEARLAISSGRQRVFLSAASTWEIGIKSNLGKLHAPKDIPSLMQLNRFSELAISIQHSLATSTLPPLHKDPFDRLLVVQAKLENLVLVTRDEVVLRYEVDTLTA